METNLLDRMLSAYLTAQTPVSITLQNKIRVTGKIKAFDSYVIVMEGQKREIVYRHAVSCLAELSPDEQKRPALSLRPLQTKPAARTVKGAAGKPRPAQPQASLSASSNETSINNSMKEGLLRWMREQKAAK